MYPDDFDFMERDDLDASDLFAALTALVYG
jgi:hypothetical protein